MGRGWGTVGYGGERVGEGRVRVEACVYVCMYFRRDMCDVM